MLSKIDFKQYAETRKVFYDELSEFIINQSQISEPIKIDMEFIDRINKHLERFIIRRLESNKLSKKENKECKDLIKKWFPELNLYLSIKGQQYIGSK